MNKSLSETFHSESIPSVREIEVFLTLENERSITEASNRLHLSQSQLSRILRQLELKLKTRLFRRSTAGLTLTLDGETFRQVAFNLRKSYGEEMLHFWNVLAGESGEVRVSILPSVAFESLGSWTESFRQTYPQATITADDDISGQGLHGLLDGKTDVAISACLLRTSEGNEHKLFPQLNKFRVVPLFTEEFYYVSNAGRSVPDSDDWKFALEKANLGFTDQTSIHRSLDLIATLEGNPYAPVTRTSSPLTIAGLVAAGLGSAIVPKSNLGIMKIKQLTTTPLDKYRRVVCVVTLGTQQTALIQHFVDTLTALREEHHDVSS